MEGLSVYCADVGSIANQRFGWYSDRYAVGGGSIADLAERVAQDLRTLRPVALGFECPLFVPVVNDPQRLGCSRPGERSRSWSAGAGAGVLATGLVQVLWLLHEIRARVGDPSCRAYLRWQEFIEAGQGLFLWEAFVSGAGKGDSHVADAHAAVDAFRAALPDPDRASCISCSDVHSLVGAALLRTGWTTELSVLATPSPVIRAELRLGRLSSRFGS